MRTAIHRAPTGKTRTSPARTVRLGLSNEIVAPPRDRRTPPSSTMRAARLRVLKKRARHSQTSTRHVSAGSLTRERLPTRRAGGASCDARGERATPAV